MDAKTDAQKQEEAKLRAYAEWDYLWAVANGYAEPQHGETKEEVLERWRQVSAVPQRKEGGI